MNPFEKRATEYIRDDVAFLPYVTPEPLLTYLEPYAKDDRLFDRLVVLIGSPGSGKTTLARLFVLPTLTTLLRNQNLSSHASLTDALGRCGAIGQNGTAEIAGCRIPMESDYRDCWELPYSDIVRSNLLFSLLQARAVLAWIRGFEESGYALEKVQLIPRADAAAALEAIGGSSMERLRAVAQGIERDVYGITASLMPPPVDALPAGATTAYRPFDVIEAFEVPTFHGSLRLKPLLICDDAHVLHPTQFDELLKWLARREIRVARWLLTRIDALRPQEVLRPGAEPVDGGSGFSRGRDMVPVWMQSAGDRASNRRSFRKIAKDMAERYLQQMPVFARHGLTRLEDLLDGNSVPLAASKIKQLEDSLRTGRRRSIGDVRRAEIISLVDDYLHRSEGRSEAQESPEIRLMMIRILMERYLKRVPQPSLFEETIEDLPSTPLKADSTVRNAAEMQLSQEFGRPFFYGFDTLCDAATENAEKFLRLAGHLVAQIETQIIRKREVILSAEVQDKLLRERARSLLDEEDIPERSKVMQLCKMIAKQCLEQTRGELNARLGEGANAWGIRQTEFDSIPSTQPDLARALQSGVAYNMFTLVRDYGTKGEIWCLVELSGSWSLREGLSLKRGQFLERTLADLLLGVGSEP